MCQPLLVLVCFAIRLPRNSADCYSDFSEENVQKIKKSLTLDRRNIKTLFSRGYSVFLKCLFPGKKFFFVSKKRFPHLFTMYNRWAIILEHARFQSWLWFRKRSCYQCQIHTSLEKIFFSLFSSKKDVCYHELEFRIWKFLWRTSWIKIHRKIENFGLQ